MAYDSITEGPILGALLGALSLQPVMTTMLHLMNMVRKKNSFILYLMSLNIGCFQYIHNFGLHKALGF